MISTWEKANFGHREDLQQFSCVAPGARPSPVWVDQVDRFIHRQLPPVDPPNYLSLYFEEYCLAGVCAHQRQDWDYWFVQAIAVAGSICRRGKGREILSLVLDEIAVRAAERNEPEVIVECVIHERNSASQRLFTWAGFRSMGPDRDTPEAELWQFVLLTPALSEDWEPLAW